MTSAIKALETKSDDLAKKVSAELGREVQSGVKGTTPGQILRQKWLKL